MVFQSFPQLVPQERSLGDLMEILPAVKFKAAGHLLRHGELAPVPSGHIRPGLHTLVEAAVGQPHPLLIAAQAVRTGALQPGKADHQHLAVQCPCEPKGGIAAAVSHDNLTPRLPLQLLQRITQDCKAVRGFMPPGYGVEIQQFFTAGYFYQNTVKHHKETSCHAAWARSSAARSTKNDSCLYCSSAKVTAAPPRESRYWRPFLDFEM